MGLTDCVVANATKGGKYGKYFEKRIIPECFY
jgi:hypothetical protein